MAVRSAAGISGEGCLIIGSPVVWSDQIVGLTIVVELTGVESFGQRLLARAGIKP